MPTPAHVEQLVRRHRPDLQPRPDLAVHHPDIRHHPEVRIEVRVERSARARGASVSPDGGGTIRTTASRISCVPIPIFAEARTASVASIASRSSISSATRSGSAAGRSILLITGTSARSFAHRQIDVGDRLRLHPLRRVHHQDRPLAGGEAPRHFVGEVHVPRRVDQVQLVLLPRHAADSSGAPTPS